MANLPPVTRQKPLPTEAPGNGGPAIERPPATSAGEILGEAEIAVLMTDLNRLPGEILAAQERVTDLEVELSRYKGLDLPRAKGALEGAINAASMEAYGSGQIDGKNAEQRKMQLDAYLAKDAGVREAQAVVDALEGQIATIEAQLAGATGELKGAANRFAATRAQAELWAARLRALAALDLDVA